MNEDRAALDIIDRAISVRPILKLDEFLASVHGAGVPTNASLARLVLAHLEEFHSSEAEAVCTDLICEQSNWKDLLAELIRYSVPSKVAFNVFIKVMHRMALGHPILSHVKRNKIRYVGQAFSAQLIASGVALRAPEDYVHYKDAHGVLISIDNPTEWYSTFDSAKVQGQTLNLACHKDGGLFSDGTIVIKPAIVAIYSK